MVVLRSILLFLWYIVTISIDSIGAWAPPPPPLPQTPSKCVEVNEHDAVASDTRRRNTLFILSSSAAIVGASLAGIQPVYAAATGAGQRAVGSAEIECRKAGNCLEIGEWDGAIGWGWGGKDRCDASDPLCGTDGQLRSSAIVGKPVPSVPSNVRFTHIAAIQIEVGRGEVGVLKLGLYGNEAPGAVSELVDFLSLPGFVTAAPASTFEQLGAVQPPVSLQIGGAVTAIVPNTIVELGVPIQSNAYARSLGRARVSDSFVPQPRPSTSLLSQDTFIRSHDCAGLVSVPEKGLGYGGTGFESDDECYESAFLITADAAPTLDKQRRRVVVGQILDAESMAFLERLANIPTKRGIRGVIPGQTSGPPLPKVVVRQIQTSKVVASS